MYRIVRLRPVPTVYRLGFALRRGPPSLTIPKAHAQIFINTPGWQLFHSSSLLRFADSKAPTKSTTSRAARFVGTTVFAILAFGAGFLFQTQQTISRLMAAPVSVDEEIVITNGLDDRSLEIDNYIYNHPLTTSLRENPAFTESRPHTKIPEGFRARNLTAGTLAGPDKIAVPPYYFNEEGGKSLVSIFYLGSDVCGHPGIVHGGLLATLLDEGLARCCFPALPNKVGVTANLNIDYRRPAMANSHYVLRAETVKVEGRKAWVEGRIQTLPEDGKEPVVLVEAKALFVEPKQVAAMASLYNVEA